MCRHQPTVRLPLVFHVRTQTALPAFVPYGVITAVQRHRPSAPHALTEYVERPTAVERVPSADRPRSIIGPSIPAAFTSVAGGAQSLATWAPTPAGSIRLKQATPVTDSIALVLIMLPLVRDEPNDTTRLFMVKLRHADTATGNRAPRCALSKPPRRKRTPTRGVGPPRPRGSVAPTGCAHPAISCRRKRGLPWCGAGHSPGPPHLEPRRRLSGARAWSRWR